MTTPAPSRSTSTTRRPQWIRTCGWLLTRTLYLMLWGWAIAIVLVTVTLAIVSRYVGIEMSGFAFSHQGMLWYPFALAIIFTTMYLPSHVTNGMTRRSFIQATIVVNIVVGTANAAFSMVALLVERAIYHQLGWFQGHTDGKGADLLASGAATYGLGLVLLFVGGMISGALVGITYHRFGVPATFLLPLTLAPIIGTSLLGLNASTQWTPWDFAFLGEWQGSALLGVLILAAGCAFFALVARRIPIDTRKA